MFRTHKKLSIAVGLIAALALSAGAYAYWTQAGTGSGSAATGTVVGITIVQTSAPTGLYPGGPTAPLAGTFTNTNSGPVYVNAVSATVSSVTQTAEGIAAGPCETSNYQLNGFPLSIAGEVLANDSTTWSGTSIQLLNTSVNQDGCKGATANITYTSN
jgi:hypothetical protein